MPRYRDPRAPEGRVVFGGVEFIDGMTADITPGPGTLELFAAAGITPDSTDEPGAPDDASGTGEVATPTPRRKK